MAAALVQNVTVRTTGSSPGQITLPGVTAGSLITVIATDFDQISAVSSSNGGALTKAVGYADGSPGTDYNEVGVWYLANVAAGSHVLSISSTGGGANSYISASGQEWSGIVTASPVDRTGTGADSLSATCSAANTQAAVLVLTAAVGDLGSSNIGYGTPSGYTLLDRENDSNSFTGYQAAYKAVSGIETSTATHTATAGVSTQYDVVIATFKVAGGATDYPLPVTAASYSVTASAETLAAGRALPVTAASYAVTTSAITLAVGRKVDAAATSYALSAAAVGLRVDRKLDIAAASYALSAANITLTYAPTAQGVDFAAASYSLTAAAESFGVDRKLAYDAATYTLSASAETLAVGRAVNFVATSYALTTSAETLTATRALSVDPASYSLSAAPVTLVYESLNKSIDIEPAAYSLSMADVGMFRSGGGGVDSWGSVYARKKKKPEVTVAGPPPGPTVRESIEQTWAAAEAKNLPKQPTRVRPVEFDEDEDEVLLLLH